MSIRRFCLSAITAALTTLYASTSLALVNECTNDIDCPNGATCGGDVCQWDSAGNHTCVAAGTNATGSDGWCTADTDCKCMAEGATCATIHCTFTQSTSGSAGSGSAGTSSTSSGN